MGPSRALSFSPCTSVYPVASRSRSLPYGSEPRVALTSLLRSACDCLVGPSLPFSSSPCTSFYPLASRARSLPSGLRLLVAFRYLVWCACDSLYRSIAAYLFLYVHFFSSACLSFSVAPIRARASRSLYISGLVCTGPSLSVPRCLPLALRVPLYLRWLPVTGRSHTGPGFA